MEWYAIAFTYVFMLFDLNIRLALHFLYEYTGRFP
jgi:hypothetical protein